MLTSKPTSQAPTYRRPHTLRPAPAVDAATGKMYDVATLLHELQHDAYNDEPLAEKLDLFLDQIIKWADDDSPVNRVKEIHEIIYRLRNAFAGVRQMSQDGDC